MSVEAFAYVVQWDVFLLRLKGKPGACAPLLSIAEEACEDWLELAVEFIEDWDVAIEGACAYEALREQIPADRLRDWDEAMRGIFWEGGLQATERDQYLASIGLGDCNDIVKASSPESIPRILKLWDSLDLTEIETAMMGVAANAGWGRKIPNSRAFVEYAVSWVDSLRQAAALGHAGLVVVPGS